MTGVFKNRTVFITGATAGIGFELARQFHQQGANVFATGRRVERLEALAKELGTDRIQFSPADVCQMSQLKSAVARCVEVFGGVDIAIANAGFGVSGALSDLNIEDYRRQFETNVFGVLNTVYALEPELLKSKGQLVLMGSVAGFVPLPGNSAYTMSKFSIRALAGALQFEWKPKGISVTHLAPGFVDSDIRRVDNQGHLKEEHPDPVPSWVRVRTESAVKEILRAIQKRKNQKVITGHGKVIYFLNQYFVGLLPWLIGCFGLRSRPEPK